MAVSAPTQFYKTLINEARSGLGRLAELDRKRTLTAAERQLIPQILGGITRGVFVKVNEGFREIDRAHGVSPAERVKIARTMLGVPAGRMREISRGQVVMTPYPYAHAVALNLVLGELGADKVGLVETAGGHAATTVKIHGTSYVADPALSQFGEPAPTMRGYTKLLRDAARNPRHPLHGSVVDYHDPRKIEAELQEPLHYRGEKAGNAALAAAYRETGAVILADGRHQALGLELLETATAADPTNFKAHAQLAAFHTLNGHPDEAVKHASAALESRDCPETRMAMAQALVAAGRPRDAAPHLQTRRMQLEARAGRRR